MLSPALSLFWFGGDSRKKENKISENARPITKGVKREAFQPNKLTIGAMISGVVADPKFWLVERMA